MPLFSHTGLSDIDYGPGALRADLSDTLFASLILRPNFTAAMPIGQYGGGGVNAGQGSAQMLLHSWLEDRYNPRAVTVTNSQSGTSTTFNTSAADNSVLDIGYVLSDNAQDPSVAELVQVTGLTPATPSATVSRGFNGTTTATHAASAVWSVIATPQIQNSDLGRDMSRAPGVKFNPIQTTRRDVNISASMIALAQHGMVPGIPNQMGYQLHQRFVEMLVDIENSNIKGIGIPTGTSTEYQTLHGILAWTGRTPTATLPNSTSQPLNAQGAAISDTLINSAGIQIFNQGAEVPDFLLGSAATIDKIGRIYRDQLRLSQDELLRGYFVDAIRTSLGTRPVRMILTGYMPDSVFILGDLDRIKLVPFLDQFCYLITAPSFRDGDAMSVVAKWTMEVRNTGTDFGYSHLAVYNYA